MKIQLLIICTLIFGLSYETFAGTGGASDGLRFFLFVIGILMLILGLIAGGEYLNKNGKILIFKAIKWVKKIIVILHFPLEFA